VEHRVERRVGRRRPSLVAIGDLILDIVVRADAPLVGGTDVPGTITLRAGGSAANTCRAFAALGGRATFIGAVGDDGVARRLRAALRAEGVMTRLVTTREPTARLVAVLGARGERSFITQRGAADRLRPADVRPAWLRGAGVLHLPAYSLLAEPLASAARAAAEQVRGAGGLVSLDLASHRPLLVGGRAAATRRLRDVGADILLANAAEARALAGGATESLLNIAPIVVIKEGADGCRVLWRAGDDAVRELDVATASIDTADTTGAGDAFDAGFLNAISRTDDPRASLHRAQVLRRAAVAGHRAAARLLRRPRGELDL
jgi:sugar/nucleoside kinase (ribokinase family)